MFSPNTILLRWSALRMIPNNQPTNDAIPLSSVAYLWPLLLWQLLLYIISLLVMADWLGNPQKPTYHSTRSRKVNLWDAHEVFHVSWCPLVITGWPTSPAFHHPTQRPERQWRKHRMRPRHSTCSLVPSRQKCQVGMRSWCFAMNSCVYHRVSWLSLTMIYNQRCLLSLRFVKRDWASTASLRMIIIANIKSHNHGNHCR